jgi:RNA polymerase sigma-70 factor (ECF subfamily)
MEENPRPAVKQPDMDASPNSIRGQLAQLLPRLRRFAIALTGSIADGDDLTQDTVERALKSLHQWEPGTRLDSWMFRIAKNRFIDTRRAARRSGLVVTDAPEEASGVATDGVRAMESRLALQDVSRALGTLPIEQREAVALVLIDGASYREAADILDIPIGTLTSRIARARDALADLVPET